MAYSFVDPTVLERLSPSSCCTITGALLVLSIPSSHTDFSPFHPHTGHRAELSAVYTDFSWRDGSVALILQRRQGSVTMRSYGARGGKFATIRSDPGMTLGPRELIGMSTVCEFCNLGEESRDHLSTPNLLVGSNISWIKARISALRPPPVD